MVTRVIVKTLKAIYLVVLSKMLINIYFYFLQHLPVFPSPIKATKRFSFYASAAVLCFLLYFRVFKLQNEAVERQSCLRFSLVLLLVELYSLMPPEVNDDRFIYHLGILKILPSGLCGDGARSVKALPCEQWDLSLIPQLHIEIIHGPV